MDANLVATVADGEPLPIPLVLLDPALLAEPGSEVRIYAFQALEYRGDFLAATCCISPFVPISPALASSMQDLAPAV
jgi:hypothetical protein